VPYLLTVLLNKEDKMKRWTELEIDFLKEKIDNKVKYSIIAEDLNRTEVSVCAKAQKLGLKSKYKQIGKNNSTYIREVKEKHNNLVTPIEVYVNNSTNIKHICNKKHIWYATPNNILSKKSKCPICFGNTKLNTLTYKNKLSEHIILLEDYINYDTPILHKNIECNHSWKVRPHDILGKLTDCPLCNKYKPAYVYCIYFKELSLYKVGITKSIKKRMQEFGYKPEIIFTRYFNIGKDAISLENKYLKNLKNYLINTGKLTTGNTETFVLDDV